MKSLQRRQVLTRLAALTAAPMLAPWAKAQAPSTWPTPSKIVVPFPAGGGVDVTVRKLAESLAKQLNATIIMDNKPGASGQIAVQAAAKSKPDGSTIFYMHAGILTAQAISGRTDVLKDFKMISKISTAPHALIVPGASPYKTLGELMAAMKAAPGKLNYGTGGAGSNTHLMFEMLDDKVPGGLNATPVPYKGAIESVTAMLGGEIDFGFVLPVSVIEHVKTGKLRVLATTGTVRMPLLPQVPTIAEAGVPGYSAEPWGGFAVPAGTPDAVVDRLMAALKASLALPVVAEMIVRTGGRIETSASPAAFEKFVREELERDIKLVKKLGLKPE
jgi:tripartite-type tricarboxylate transporter receptor subunit TctC